MKYHIRIMAEEGLIEATDLPDSEGKGPESVPRALTWKGHEFLDLARNQRRWDQAKAIIKKLGSAPISIWLKVLNDLMLKDLAAVSS